MRKLRARAFALVSPLLLSFFQFAQSPSLAKIYSKGPILLQNSSGYGEKTDWTILFYNTFTDIVAAPDGTVFAASSRQHKIFKFDAAGNLIKTFGQEGQGAGDLNNPDNLSILDGNYLVVGEYALQHRISVFDLSGRFFSLLKTELPAFQATALRDGVVAYLGIQHRERDDRHYKIESVRIKDVETGTEKILCAFEYPHQSIMVGMSSIGFGDGTAGKTHIVQGRDGNLIVGNSMKPELEVYDTEGNQTAVIPLNLNPIPVTKQFIRAYKKKQLDELRQEANLYAGFPVDPIKALEKADLSILFSEHLPFYRLILTDEEGNILIFSPAVCIDDCPVIIRIYSPAGKYYCEAGIDEGDYDLIYDSRRRHLSFTSGGLYALVQPKSSDEFLLRLIKVIY